MDGAIDDTSHSCPHPEADLWRICLPSDQSQMSEEMPKVVNLSISLTASRQTSENVRSCWQEYSGSVFASPPLEYVFQVNCNLAWL